MPCRFQYEMENCSFLHFHRPDEPLDCLLIVSNLVNNEFVTEMVADIDGVLADIGSCIYSNIFTLSFGHDSMSLMCVTSGVFCFVNVRTYKFDITA